MTETETPAPVRTVDGRNVPAAGRWEVDTAHSSVEFVARHLVVTKVRGRFTDYSVTMDVGEKPEDSTVDVTIQAGSITTGDDGRDAHLRGPDFLDAERFPRLRFVSTSVDPSAGDRWSVKGELTIRDTTRPVVLDVEFGGTLVDPWGNAKALFSASAEIDREDWGLTWNQPLAGGGVLVGRKVVIELEVQAASGAPSGD